MPGSSDEEIVILRHDAGLTIYNFFIGVDPASSTAPVEYIILALAGLHTWDAIAIDHLSEKKTRGGRRQKKYFCSFGNLHCAAIMKVVEAFGPLAEY